MNETESFELQTVWRQYQQGLAYQQRLGLTETIAKCEDFYIGNQWRGLAGCEDLDRPVMNILKRVVSYFISSIVSDDIGISLSPFEPEEGGAETADMLQAQLLQVMEQAGVKKLLRTLLRDAAVDGDGCLHYWFDPTPCHGQQQGTPGRIMAEALNSYNLFYGNPQSGAVQSQPYILVRFRRRLEDLKAELGDRLLLQADPGESGVNEEAEEGKVTVIRKYARVKGSIVYCEVCRSGVLVPPTDTGLRLYPLAVMPWETVKNRCYGRSALESLIPNQIFINKLYAMAMRHVQLCAFPKIVYNRLLLPQGPDNRVGEAIPVNGSPDMAVGQGFKVPDMSTQVLQMIRQVIADTRDTMGASDASLGNVKPDNTSAIIALQKATGQPLELQKLAFYDTVEDSVRIWLDMMAACYGLRPVSLKNAAGIPERVLFDFSLLRRLDFKPEINIGAGSYYSELMQTSTLDNLYRSGILTDPVLYLESLPKGCLKNRDEIVKKLKEAERVDAPQVLQAGTSL